MFEFTIRQKIAAIVLLVFLISGGLLLFLAGDTGRAKEYIPDDSETKIYVQICGAVVKPGVIALKPGIRKFEALEKVGGALPEADLNRVNLAEYVEDGEQVYIPKQGEILAFPTKKSSVSKNIKKIKDPDEITSKKTSNQPAKLSGPIDLNTATQVQLEILPGIGPFLAQKIIEYRNQHGIFQHYEELDNVSGIGPAKIEKLRPFLTVR